MMENRTSEETGCFRLSVYLQCTQEPKTTDRRGAADHVIYIKSFIISGS